MLTRKVHVSLLAGNMLRNESVSQQEEHNLRANYLGTLCGIKMKQEYRGRYSKAELSCQLLHSA